MEKAAFKLDGYRFTKASLNFNISSDAELDILFNPHGVFSVKEARYTLEFEVSVRCKQTDTEVICVFCEASFSFCDQISFEQIPEYFYPNSVAIIFPYIRAFVSTISLQANVNPIVLPTINLTGLTGELKRQTKSE